MKKIKFSIRLFAMIIGLLLIMQVPTFAAKGKSTATNVRVRKTASTEAEVIDLLATNDVVEILSKEGDWYKISFNGKTGYVSQSFISTEEEIEENNTQNPENNEQTEPSNEQNGENVSNSEEQNNENINNIEEPNSNQGSEENTNQGSNSNVENTQTTANVTTTTVYKMVENTSLNILPVVTSEFIGEVAKDDEVTLVSSAGLWVYIKTGKVAGWVRIDKLSTEGVPVENSAEAGNNEENNQNSENTEPEENIEVEEEENQNDNNDEESNYTPKTMYSKVSALNVRSEANTTSSVIDSLGMNAQVTVVGEENGWYKVQVNGKTGYIRQDFLANEKTQVSSRGNEIDRAAAKGEEVVTPEPVKTADTGAPDTVTTEPAVAEEPVAPVTATTDAIPTPETITPTPTAATPTPATTAPVETTTETSSTGVTGKDIAAYAKQFIGCRYVYGAAGPNSFDCSGLTMYVYKHFGYSLSHSSKVQATQGRAVTGELQPGDILVFSNDGKTVGHVGIYIGNDQFVHAADSSTGVAIGRLSDRWNKSKYWGARRII